LTTSDPAFEELLSRYFDGELSPGEALQVEACLQEESEAVEQLERLGQTRTLVRDSFKGELERMDFSDFWSGVEAGIDRQAQLEETPRGVRAPVQPNGPSVWERLRDWIDRIGWQPVGMGLAAAAVLFAVGLSLRPGPDVPVAKLEPILPPASNPVTQPEDSAAGGVNDDAVAALPADELKIDGVEVKSLDGGATSTVMVLHSPDEATIIWVHEEGEGGTSI